MKKIISLICLIALFGLGGCVTMDTQRIDALEQKITKLERQVLMGVGGGAAASIYPVTGGFGGETTGTLDNIASTADKDAAFVIFNDETTWGNAFFPMSLDVDGGGTEAIPYIVKANDGGNEDWEWVDVYGRRVFGGIHYVTTAINCTIGTDCDGTKVRVAWGGIIESTADGVIIILPEIAATPTATQVPVGASLIVYNRDANEDVFVDPNGNDSITLGGTKGAAGNYITLTNAATTAGNYVALVATAADNWTVFGYSGTWTAE